jgi:hypothetical protein
VMRRKPLDWDQIYRDMAKMAGTVTVSIRITAQWLVEYTRFVNSKVLNSSASSMSLQCHLCALVTLGMSRIAWILARSL